MLRRLKLGGPVIMHHREAALELSNGTGFNDLE